MVAELMRQLMKEAMIVAAPVLVAAVGRMHGFHCAPSFKLAIHNLYSPWHALAFVRFML